MSFMLRVTQLCPILFDPVLCLWDSPGKNPGVGNHSLLQGIFLAQGSNPGFLHCRQILYCLSHQESPKVIGACKYTVLSATVVLPPKLNGVILIWS